MVAVLVRLPEVPVTVTVTVPVVAVLLAVSVKVLEFVVLTGLNKGVTPLDRPDADNATLPLKPLSGLTVIVLELLAPCVMVMLLGEAERVKFGGGFTVKESVVEFVKSAAVPVMVTAAVPVVAVPLAVNVSVLVPVVLAGLNDAVTPAGKPEADKLTVPLKPFSALMAIVLLPLAPCATVRLLGDEESAKLPWGFALSERVVVLVKLPDVPVMVTVKVPVAAMPLADRVKTLLAVAGFVPKVALTPPGKPDADKVTVPLNPLRGCIEMVAEPEVP